MESAVAPRPGKRKAAASKPSGSGSKAKQTNGATHSAATAATCDMVDDHFNSSLLQEPVAAQQPAAAIQPKRKRRKQQQADELVDLSPSTQQDNVVPVVPSARMPHVGSVVTAGVAAAAASAAAASHFPLTQASGASVCSICLDALTTEGAHRICCLKCGHLFGVTCITKWLAEKKSCPTCKAKALPVDIRRLFIAGITVLDTAPLQSALDRIQAKDCEILQLRSALYARECELTKANRKYEHMAASHHRLQNKAVLSRSQEKMGGALTYIMSPTLAPGVTVDYTRDPPPSNFQYAPLSMSAAPPAPQNGYAYSGPQLAHSSMGPPPPFALSHPSNVPSATRASSYTPASSTPAPFAAAPRASSAAPALPSRLPPPSAVAGPARPKPAVELNPLAFPMVEICAIEGGRCVDFDDLRGNILLSACPSQYPAVNEWTHGCIKSDVNDITTRHYLPLHSKPIRDLHFHSPRQLLLSCSFDRTAKISSMSHGSVVTVFDLPQPAWSCQWSSFDENLVHVGLQTGEMLVYDVRSCATPLVTCALPSKQPLHSIVSIGSATDPVDAVRGVIAATSAHVILFKATPVTNSWSQFELPISPVTRMSAGSVAFDGASGFGVCAVRPSSASPGAAMPTHPSTAMCTVFRIDRAAGSAQASSTPAHPPSAVRPARWSIPLHSSQHVQPDYSRPFPLDPSAIGLECSCISQLTGHEQRMAFTRAAIWSYPPTGAADSGTPSRVLAACGDDESNQVSG